MPGCSTPVWSGSSGWAPFGGGSPAEDLGIRFTALATLCPGGWLYTGSGGGWSGVRAYLWEVATGSSLAAVDVSTGQPSSRYAFAWPTPIPLVIGQDYIIAFSKNLGSAYAGIIPEIPVPASGYWTWVADLYAVGIDVLPTTPIGGNPGIEPQVCDGATYVPPGLEGVTALMTACCADIAAILASVRRNFPPP